MPGPRLPTLKTGVRKPRRPPPEPRGNISGSLPHRQLSRLHALAAERHITLTKLVNDALIQTYLMPEEHA